MKKLEVNQMENLNGGTNRQCMIDGGLTAVGMGLGSFFGPIGVVTALVTGLYAANSNGCFN